MPFEDPDSVDDLSGPEMLAEAERVSELMGIVEQPELSRDLGLLTAAADAVVVASLDNPHAVKDAADLGPGWAEFVAGLVGGRG